MPLKRCASESLPKRARISALAKRKCGRFIAGLLRRAGVMVTDTAPFRNPNYHTPNDKPETLDYDRLARVTAGLIAVVAKLAQ